jgi:hypothetical protein
MSRRRTPRDGDAHDRFLAWLVSGASGNPPRDAALHASVCPDCALQLGAFDLLTEIDTRRAGLPPSRVGVVRNPWLRAARAAGGASGVAMVAVVAGVALGSALQVTPTATGPSESTVQEVLGGRGTPVLSDSPPAATAEPTLSVTESPTPDPAPTR